MKTAPVSINRLLIPLNNPIEINALRHDSSIVEISDCVAALRDGTLGADIAMYPAVELSSRAFTGRGLRFS
jgi:hypothetical protein